MGSKVHLGSDVTLTCKATGKVKLEWFKIDMNGTRTNLSSRISHDRLPSGRTETICTLRIMQFDESNDGFYRCLLTRSFVVWRFHDEVYRSVKGKYHCLLYNLKSCLSPFLVHFLVVFVSFSFISRFL